MTVEAELMAAIVAAPADDEPRLVYADHLMQRGDLLGELITLQCRIARADAADEPLDDGVLARERELREAHGEAWTFPLTAIAKSDYVLRRGFVEHVTAWTAHVVVAPRLLVIDEEEEPPPEPRDGLAEMLDAAPLLDSVAVRGDIVDDGLITDAWKRIRSLTLFNTKASLEFIMPFLGRLDSLCRLQLTCAEATDDAARAWLSLPQSLEHLGFHIGWHVTHRPACDVAALIADHQPDLRSLHIGNFTLTNPQALAALTKLERLAVHRIALTGRQLVDLVAALPALEVFEFENSHQGLGELDLRALLAAAPKLRRLAIRHCQVDAAALAQATSLRRIDLEGCRLDEDAARTLLASESLRSVGWWRITQSGGLPLSTLEEVAARQTLKYEAPIPKFPAHVVAPLPNKIEAIKQYRRMTGVGLADAKMDVERMMEELGMGPSYETHRAIPRWVRP